jgi:hypothetical protein
VPCRYSERAGDLRRIVRGGAHEEAVVNTTRNRQVQLAIDTHVRVFVDPSAIPGRARCVASFPPAGLPCTTEFLAPSFILPARALGGASPSVAHGRLVRC